MMIKKFKTRIKYEKQRMNEIGAPKYLFLLLPYYLVKKILEVPVQFRFKKKLAEIYKKEKKPIIKVNNYKMYIDPFDKGLSRELVLNRTREKESTEFMQSFLSKDDVCVDVGANKGYYTLLMAKKTKIVYAIEPLKENIEY